MVIFELLLPCWLQERQPLSLVRQHQDEQLSFQQQQQEYG